MRVPTSSARTPDAAGQKRRPPSFPRVPLYSAIALIVFAMAAVIFGQTTEIGTVRNKIGKPVAIRDIVLIVHADDRITVTDAISGAPIDEIAGDKGGFVRGAMHGLNRMRLVAEVDQDQPYRIIKWQNGWVSLSDTGTGQRLYLNAFGPDNAAAFEKYLENAGSKS